MSRRNSSPCCVCSDGAGGARTHACRVHTHVNAKPGVRTRPQIFLDRRDHPRPDGVPLDIPRNAIPLVLVSDPMIVRFPLPKGFARPTESFVRLPCGASLKRLQKQSRGNHRQEKHVDVIGHDDERADLVVPQFRAAEQRIHDDLRDGVLPQERGAGPGLVQIPVDPAERFSRCCFRRGLEFSNRQTAEKRPGYEQPAAFRIAVGQAAAGVHKSTSALPSLKISRSHECERGTQECVRHVSL